MKPNGQNASNALSPKRGRAIAAFIVAIGIALGPFAWMGAVEKSLQAGRFAAYAPTVVLALYSLVAAIALVQTLYALWLWRQAEQAERKPKKRD